MNFDLQTYFTGQLVTAANMNNTYQDKDQKITSYFPLNPCIPSGITFQQTGTSNVITFGAGVFRFADQPNANSVGESQMTEATYAGGSVTITVPEGPTPQYYIVALLTQTTVDSNNITNTATISPEAMTLAQIVAAPIPLAYLIISAITNIGGVYTLFNDSNCAFNYGSNYNSDFNRLNTITGTSYSISMFDGGSLIYQAAGGCNFTFPLASNFPVGFTVCIYNSNATNTFTLINYAGTNVVPTTGTGAYYKIVTDGGNWSVNGTPQTLPGNIYSDFNRFKNITGSYAVSLADGFSILQPNAGTVTITFPNSSNFPQGFTVCINTNANGFTLSLTNASSGTNTYVFSPTGPAVSTSGYIKIVVYPGANGGWTIDGQDQAWYAQRGTLSTNTIEINQFMPGPFILNNNALSGRYILKYGFNYPFSGGPSSINFFTAFPNTCLALFPSLTTNFVVNPVTSMQTYAYSASLVLVDTPTSGAGHMNYIAIGY